MGFLEKLKNTFFEEEYVEVEEKVKPKKEVVKEVRKSSSSDIRPLIEDEKRVRTIRKDEIVHEGLPEKKYEEIRAREKESVRAKEEVVERPVSRNSFNYYENDFIDYTENVKPVREERVVPVIEDKKEKTNVYNNPDYASKSSKVNQSVSTAQVKSTSTAYSKQMAAGFKPTPIISPIYGILDQNYTKDEIVEKKDIRPSSYVSRKNVDLDSVREKAFGSLSSDLGLTGQEDDMLDNIQDDTSDLELDNNLLYDMTDITTTPTVDKVTLQDAEEYFQDLGLEYNIDYKDAKLERATGRRVAKNPKTLEIEEDEVEETKIYTGISRINYTFEPHFDVNNTNLFIKSTGHFYDPHGPFKGLFAAVRDAGQLLSRRKTAFYREILPNDLVCPAFDFCQLLRGGIAVKIHLHHIGTDVKTHIVAAEFFVEQAGNDVLAGVLLH